MKKQAKKSKREEEEEYTLYEGLETVGDLGSGMTTVKQLIKALESEIKYLKELQAAGVDIQMDGNDQGMLVLKTENKKIAHKYKFHKQKVVGGQVEDVLVRGKPVYA